LSYPLPTRLREKHRKQFHVVNYYNAEELRDKLEQTGFSVLSHKYLINSPVTSFLSELTISTYGRKYKQLMFSIFSSALIPILIASDRVMGKKNCGYTLLIKARRK
ncbi:hypothetical protein ACFLVR_05070, partial [Chloroflexota bacterium]